MDLKYEIKLRYGRSSVYLFSLESLSINIFTKTNGTATNFFKNHHNEYYESFAIFLIQVYQKSRNSKIKTSISGK